MKSRLWILGIILGVVGGPGTGEAGSHLWRFNELFTNSDGTIQFIEMKECCGATAENGLNQKWILAVDADNMFTFPANIEGNTAGQHLLLATQGFADLPGVPTPDFIIPDNFLPKNGDTLEYWQYQDATILYGALPTDGVTSWDVRSGETMNSPTNFAGETGTIDVTPVNPATWGQLKARWFRVIGLW